MKIQTMNDLYYAMLKDIYFAEKKLLKALPKMAKNATSPALRSSIQGHLEETNTHVERLEEVFESLGRPAKAEKCEAIEGLVSEAEDMMSESKDKQVLDAAIIAAAQKVEHYEIATYGTLCEFANALGYDEQASILRATLEEEKGANNKLTKLASSNINLRAIAA